MEIDVITEEDMQLIENKINKDIKALTGNIDSHAKSLHNMFEAINAISNMVGTHKDLMDSYKELFDTLTERTKLLQELCQLKKK